jgi:hypothetical protein
MNSCINYCQNETTVILRESLLEICENNPKSAILLNYLISCYDLKITQIDSDCSTNKEDLLINLTLKEIFDALLGMYSIITIRKAIEHLKQLSFIEVLHNPNPKYSFDKTQFFFLKEDAINTQLETLEDQINL